MSPSTDGAAAWKDSLLPMSMDMARAVAELEAVCFSGAWDAARYARALEQGTCWGFVCPARAQEDAVDGYIAVSSVLDEMEILNVAVRPALRGRGLGAALLAAVLQEARERNIITCLLEVREGNAAALALYTHAGFKSAGLRRRYYADGENALVMKLDLAALRTEPAR